jgi:hypothetical protein
MTWREAIITCLKHPFINWEEFDGVLQSPCVYDSDGDPHWIEISKSGRPRFCCESEKITAFHVNGQPYSLEHKS